MSTKKSKPKPTQEEQVREEDLPEIDLSSCEQFDPSKDQYLDENGSCDEDYDVE